MIINCKVCNKGTYKGKNCPVCKGRTEIKLDPSETQKCPRCDGQGQERWVNRIKNRYGRVLRQNYYWIICPLCNGRQFVVPLEEPEEELEKPTQRIQALFLTANPVGTSFIDVDKEIREITENIRMAEDRELIDAIPILAVRVKDLVHALNTYSPNIIQISSHGTYTGELVFLNKDDSPTTIKAKYLRDLIESTGKPVKIMILNACYSSRQAKPISEIVDFVIANRTAVSDEAAIIFSSTFYGALCHGLTLKKSFDQAISVLKLQGYSGADLPKFIVKEGVDSNRTMKEIIEE